MSAEPLWEEGTLWVDVTEADALRAIAERLDQNPDKWAGRDLGTVLSSLVNQSGLRPNDLAGSNNPPHRKVFEIICSSEIPDNKLLKVQAYSQGYADKVLERAVAALCLYFKTKKIDPNPDFSGAFPSKKKPKEPSRIAALYEALGQTPPAEKGTNFYTVFTDYVKEHCFLSIAEIAAYVSFAAEARISTGPSGIQTPESVKLAAKVIAENPKSEFEKQYPPSPVSEQLAMENVMGVQGKKVECSALLKYIQKHKIDIKTLSDAIASDPRAKLPESDAAFNLRRFEMINAERERTQESGDAPPDAKLGKLQFNARCLKIACDVLRDLSRAKNADNGGLSDLHSNNGSRGGGRGS